MKRKVAYVVLFAVLISFAIREAGVIYGKRFNRPLLPEWLSFLEDIDRAILFFSDRGGPVYSTINYVMILGALFGVGLLRTLKKKKAEIAETFVEKEVSEGENPFYRVIPEWYPPDLRRALEIQDKRDLIKSEIDIYGLLTEHESKGHGVRSKARNTGSDKGRDDGTRPPHDNHIAPTGNRRRTFVFELAMILLFCAIIGAVVLSLGSQGGPETTIPKDHYGPLIVGATL